MHGRLPVIRNNDLRLAGEESRRWTDITTLTINMEQIGDIVERGLLDIEDKKIKPGRHFSEAGMAEIAEQHERLIAKLRLGMRVFLNGNMRPGRQALSPGRCSAIYSKLRP